MPLQDHFHPPLNTRRHWHAFHNAWATYLAAALNKLLPEGYFAEPNVQFGIEIDVAAFEEPEFDFAQDASVFYWTPPAPTLTVPLPVVTDVVEIAVYNNEAGPTLAAAIELVSPANKDRRSHRDAFTSKCVAYLQQGIGLIIVDIVSGRQANLHHELLARLKAMPTSEPDSDLYAVSYHPVEREGQTSLDIWQESLAIGGVLPTLPLWLRGGIYLPVDFNATYEQTCREQRVPANGA